MPLYRAPLYGLYCENVAGKLRQRGEATARTNITNPRTSHKGAPSTILLKGPVIILLLTCLLQGLPYKHWSMFLGKRCYPCVAIMSQCSGAWATCIIGRGKWTEELSLTCWVEFFIGMGMNKDLRWDVMLGWIFKSPGQVRSSVELHAVCLTCFRHST